MIMKRKTGHRCPYCGRFTRFIFEPADREGSGWHRQTGLVDGRWICEQCGREM